MTEKKNISGKIQLAVLVLFIVLIPLISWYYLQAGLNYNKSLMSELRDYGKIPEFALRTQNNDTLTESDLHGKIIIANFYNNQSPFTSISTDYARRILGQFKSQKDLIFLFHSLDPADSLLKAFAKKEELLDKRAIFLSGDEDQLTRLLTLAYKIPLFDTKTEDGSISFDSDINTLPKTYPYFVLIDSSLTIRNYYDMNDEASMTRLVEHLAIILPRDVRKKAEHRPKKEM